jgi:hypothetical protein
MAPLTAKYAAQLASLSQDVSLKITRNDVWGGEALADGAHLSTQPCPRQPDIPAQAASSSAVAVVARPVIAATTLCETHQAELGGY